MDTHDHVASPVDPIVSANTSPTVAAEPGFTSPTLAAEAAAAQDAKGTSVFSTVKAQLSYCLLLF